MGYRLYAPYVPVRDFTGLFETGLRRSPNFRNMSRGGGGNIATLTERSMMRVGEVINHKNIASLLLALEMLIVLDLPTFNGSP